jgi:hypothetical protein
MTQTLDLINKTMIKAEVDRLFREMRVESRTGCCVNPFTGALFVWGTDPIGLQKNVAYKALLARQLFALICLPDVPPLPLSYNERESLKRGGLPHILAWFARSLTSHDYDLMKHPSFEDYARGVMASEGAPGYIAQDQQLQKRFPPTPLAGLDRNLDWNPPEERSRLSCPHCQSRVAA